MPKLFRGNTPVVITKNGGFTVHGQPLPSPKVNELCYVVRLVTSAVKTSVRADTSATRGAAEEEEVRSVILFNFDSQVAVDDMLEVAGEKLRVTGVERRFDLDGTLDHKQISAVVWRTL